MMLLRTVIPFDLHVFFGFFVSRDSMLQTTHMRGTKNANYVMIQNFLTLNFETRAILKRQIYVTGQLRRNAGN